MTTKLSDLWTYDEHMPTPWDISLKEIETAGANHNHVTAEKLRIQIALMTQQANIELYVSDLSQLRAEAEREAAELRSVASDKIARSLRLATWVLAAATVALVDATFLLAVAE